MRLNKRYFQIGSLLLVSVSLAVAALAIHRLVFLGEPVSTDEGSYLFQAYSLGDGQLSRPLPPMATAIKRSHDMKIMDREIGWVSRYPPGHAIWLLPGVMLDWPFLMVMISVFLTLFLLFGVSRLFKINGWIAVVLIALSPFFLLMSGTLMSHTSGILAVSLMLWSYLKLNQTGRWGYGLVAGMAWALLFLNRTYSAALIALPFAVDALYNLFRHWRERRVWMGTIAFGGSAILGIGVYMGYNFLITGDPGHATYLFYESSESLGFGVRRLQAASVVHTFGRGLRNAWDNLVVLDRWLWGISGGGVAVSILFMLGWQKRWSLLFLGACLCLVGGYVFFWFPGPRHIGPAYYYELLPFIIMGAALGLSRLLTWLSLRRRLQIATCSLGLLFLTFISSGFILEQKAYFNEALAGQQQLNALVTSLPAGSLVFLKRPDYPPFGKLTVNKRGEASDQLVMRSFGQLDQAIARHYPDREAYRIDGKTYTVTQLPAADSDDMDLSIKVPARAMRRFTGYDAPSSEEDGVIIRMADDAHEPGYLAFGRRMHLLPGHYQVRFVFDLEEPDAQGMVRIDVATDLGKVILASLSTESIDDFGDGEVNLEFTISGDDFMRVEPRVYYLGRGAVAFRYFEVNKIASKMKLASDLNLPQESDGE